MEKVLFTHKFHDNCGRRATVCGFFTDEQVRIGTAVCSHKDSFNKRIGRLISEGRARKNPDLVLEFSDSEPPGKFFVKQAEKIIKTN